jgi:hypothetical protein
MEGYLVLANDMAAFNSLFPEVDNYIGPTGFGFSGNGELLRLYDDEGVIIDTVHYDDIEPWPTEPDGNGPTLELINPAWDNALAESWAASALHGTPGAKNGNYVAVEAFEPEIPVRCRLYPNPFSSTATLRIEGTDNIHGFSFSIYNLYGQEIRRMENISTSRVFISADGLASGLYVYQLRDSQSKLIFTGKFIIE